MNQRIYRGIGAEHDTVTGTTRIRLERTTITGFSLRGFAGTSVNTSYLDGGGAHVTTTGNHRTIGTVEEAVPPRQDDVLDLARLARATQALAGAMAAHDGPVTAEQGTVWIRSYQGLCDWQRAAQTRLVASQGGIDAVGVMLTGLLALHV